MSKTFTQADVASHNKPNDLYIIVDEDVYDLTAFQDEHPGTYPSPPLPNPNSHLQITRGGLTSCNNRRKENPHPRSRQRCLEAVLEIPQRRYTQEIQRQVASRLSKHQSRVRASEGGREEGAREAEGGERGRRSCASCCAGERDVRGSGSIWRSDPVCGSELVSRRELPSPSRSYLRNDMT
jgi:hypothetical protein